MTTHTGYYLQPTLQEVISGWTSIGFTKVEAIKAVITRRLNANRAKGHGNKAAKREAMLEIAAEQPWMPTEAEVDRMAALDELRTETRIYPRTLNIHDD